MAMLQAMLALVFLLTCARESAIVPDVSLAGESVMDISQFTILFILFDWVEGFGSGDLAWNHCSVSL
jgi:hypothetical protein